MATESVRYAGEKNRIDSVESWHYLTHPHE
jgi:hypothetical protein